MRVVFAAHLQLGDGAAAHTRATLRSLLRATYGDGADEPGEHLDGDTSIHVSDLAAGEDRARTVRIRSPHRDDLDVTDDITLTVGADRGTGFVWCRRALLSTTPAITGTVSFDATSPSVFRQLVDAADTRDHHWPVAAHPEPFDLAALEAQLIDPDRTLPVIGVLAGSGVDTCDLAGALAGVAHVVDIGRRHAECPARLGVGISGAVLWWPGWPHQREQRWAPGELVDRHGSASPLIRTVCAASAFRIPTPAVLDRLAHHDARRRLTERHSGLSDEDLEAWEADLVALDSARDELTATRGELTALRGDNDALLHAWDRLVADGIAATTATRNTFDSVDAVLTWAANDLTRIEVSPEARRTGANSPYRWPQRLAAALGTLDELAGRWAEGNLPGGFSLAAREHGLPWRSDVGTVAATRYADDYTATRVDGSTVVCGPHLAWGANTGPAGHLRCYLYLDRDRHVIVVGPTGRHGRGQRNR